MPLCPNCGEDNPERARFCWSCGSALAQPAPAPEVRKTISILFCDMTGSTTMGERHDPEQLRRIMSRYYEQARLVLERHGGTVEKFIGDAVMAVFGIPVLHEDDAVRAVRSAVDLRRAIRELNEELERSFGVAIEVRIGVNTGEVIAGDPGHGHSFVAGDAVNVAQRLETSASPGEILIGEETYLLTRDAVVAEPVEPLELKGKQERVAAYRLFDVTPGAPGHARRLDSPMVGRERERGLLREAFDAVVAESSCRLVTILGPAGVGKSRLVAEALRDIGDRASVLFGGCLSYGEGITFWPVLEIVKQATGISDEDSPEHAKQRIAAALDGDDSAELAADRVAELIGLAGAGAAAEEGFWGVRKLLEALSRRGPLVVVFDDLNWAEPTLLDLVEYLAHRARGPLLIACMGRPELLELRPGWAAADAQLTLVLEPLSTDESDRLISNLLGEATPLAPSVTTRIKEAAEGNPLFVEEMLAMLIDDGLLRRENGGWVAAGDLSQVGVPPSIHALLASRLDRLEADERHVIERAAVEGKTFHQGSVRALAEGVARERVGGCLHALVRKELVRPFSSAFAGEDAFRFRHVLIREAAYESIPKQLRAQLHDRFAAWLEEVAGDRVGEYEELLGYHLEQAFRYRVELSRVDEWAQAVALRGGSRLAAAGRRALARSDAPAAVNLLGRAASLLEEGGGQPVEIWLDLGAALCESGELAGADDVLEAALDAARRAGDERLEARALVWKLTVAVQRGAAFRECLEQTRSVIAVLEQLADDTGLAQALGFAGKLELWLGQSTAAAESFEKALVYARRAGDRRDEAEALSWLLVALLFGATPASQAVARCDEIREGAAGAPQLEAFASMTRAGLLAMQGEIDHARAEIAHGRELLHELGAHLVWAAGGMVAGSIELIAGAERAAESVLRPAYEELQRLGGAGYLSTVAAYLAEALYRQSRLEQAEHFALVSEEAAAADDFLSQASARAVRAKVLARRGELEDAERLVRDAVEIAAGTDYLDLRGRTLLSLAEVQRLADRNGEAARAAEDAVLLFERKENVVMAAQARDLAARCAA